MYQTRRNDPSVCPGGDQTGTPGISPDHAHGGTGVLPKAPSVSKHWVVLLALTATILVPALFWRQMWWGAQLSDDQLNQRLSHPHKVRHAQHALEQLSKRIERDPETARPFYPKVVALADNPEPLIRSAVAWLMGEDNGHEPFQERLMTMLTDEEPIVRYNAAIALTRFANASGRAVLREMLQPYEVRAKWTGNSEEGVIADVLPSQGRISFLAQLALVDIGDMEQVAVLAPLSGRIVQVKVEKGQHVQRGDAVAVIAPEADQVGAALRALYLVGRSEDLDEVRPYLRPLDYFPVSIVHQARSTVTAIEHRGSVN